MKIVVAVNFFYALQFEISIPFRLSKGDTFSGKWVLYVKSNNCNVYNAHTFNACGLLYPNHSLIEIGSNDLRSFR